MIGLNALACRGAGAAAVPWRAGRREVAAMPSRPRMSRWQPRWPAYAAKARLTRALPASAVIAPASVAMGADS